MTLDVSGVDVHLGGKRVLEQIDTSVDHGKFVGLVGPNGAGKTTLLRTINAALSPDVGSVYLDGENVHGLSSKEASRRMATVPQNTNLSFDFTVREVVEMGRHPHRSRFGRDTDDEQVDRALDRAKVAHLADRPITEVSGGERQRVLLARALAQETPVLLLDEPTASLDINHQVRTFELVRELVDEGRTAVAAIHDLDLAARYCDDLVLVADGTVLASGSPETVLTPANLEEAFGTRVAVSTNPVTGTPTVTALPDREEGDLAVHVLGGRNAAPLLAPLVDAGFDVSVGPVPEESRDHGTATALDLDCLTVPPFESVPDRVREAARDRIAGSAVTVVPAAAADLGANPALRSATDRLVVTSEGPYSGVGAGPVALQVDPSVVVEAVYAAAASPADGTAAPLPAED